MADDEKAERKKELRAERKAARRAERKERVQGELIAAKIPAADKPLEKKKNERRPAGKKKKKSEGKKKEKQEKKLKKRLEKRASKLEKKRQVWLEQRKEEREQNRSAKQIDFPMQKLATEGTTTRFGSVTSVNLQKIRKGAFVVDFDNVPFHAYFHRSYEKRLFVLLEGFLPGENANLSAFERRPWDQLLPGSILHVADPTLAVSAEVAQGWYVGTKDRDYTKYLAQLVDRVANELGLARSEILFYANSAGGFAALMCAGLLPGASCIVVNPQIDIARSGEPSDRKHFARAFSAEADFEALEKRFRSRFSVLEAFPSADSLPPTVYVQNTKDEKHFLQHYQVFCTAYGAPKEGGISDNGRVLTLLFDYAAGHGAEPLPLVRPLIAEALAFFKHSKRGRK